MPFYVTTVRHRFAPIGGEVLHHPHTHSRPLVTNVFCIYCGVVLSRANAYGEKQMEQKMALVPIRTKKKRKYAQGRRLAKRQRGYARLGGYYGRFRGRPSSASGEWKFHDGEVNQLAVATAGNVTITINIIPQGVTESTRVGRKCTVRSIGWRYNITLHPQVLMLSTSDSVRVLMLLDKQANGGGIAVGDLLESANYQSFNNLSNSGRFRVLHDVTHSLKAQSAIAGPDTGEDTVNYSFFKKCVVPIEFSGVNGVMGEIRSNNLAVILISHSGLCEFDSKFRLRFSDS